MFERRCYPWFLALLIGVGCIDFEGQLLADVRWTLSVTDGRSVLSAIFTTDGERKDTRGEGSLTFTIKRFDRFYLDGKEFDFPVAGAPREPQEVINAAQFVWSRDDQAFVSFGEVGYIGGRSEQSGPLARSEVAIGGIGTTAFFKDDIESGGPFVAVVVKDLQVAPTRSSLVAGSNVPEPGEWAVITGVGLVLLALWRRRQATLLSNSTEVAKS